MGQIKQIPVELKQALDLEARVFRRLCNLSFPAFRNLSINVNLGKVIISGTVRSFYERQVAVNSVRQIVGVVDLTDKIKVAT